MDGQGRPRRPQRHGLRQAAHQRQVPPDLQGHAGGGGRVHAGGRRGGGRRGHLRHDCLRPVVPVEPRPAGEAAHRRAAQRVRSRDLLHADRLRRRRHRVHGLPERRRDGGRAGEVPAPRAGPDRALARGGEGGAGRGREPTAVALLRRESSVFIYLIKADGSRPPNHTRSAAQLGRSSRPHPCKCRIAPRARSSLKGKAIHSPYSDIRLGTLF